VTGDNRHNIPPKHFYLPTRLHSDTPQKTAAVFIISTVTSLNLWQQD